MIDPAKFPLKSRKGLPDALRVLLDDYPKAGWESHPNFSGLVQFWLERHMMFRQILDALQTDAQARLDNKMDARGYAMRLSRLGGMMVEGLHGHHQIEDHHYFPILKGLDTRIERGFDILDRDHQAMDGLLDRFARAANGVLGQSDAKKSREKVAGFMSERDAFARMLDRHLQDEEEIIVPVILKNGAAGLT